jgi:hypothetical protein
MASHAVRFSDLVEMIDRLPLEERESLVEVVRKRNAEDARNRIAASVRSARREHRAGKSKPVTPDELMREITA